MYYPITMNLMMFLTEDEPIIGEDQNDSQVLKALNAWKNGD